MFLNVRKPGGHTHILVKTIGKRTKMTLALRDVATREESAAALRRLSDDELRRLEQLARLRVTGLHAVDWRDLLHEAVARLLDGSRRWPRGVPLVVFLRETMRSIASDHWRRLSQPVVMTEADLEVHGEADEGADKGAFDSAADPVASPERQVSAAETLVRIEEALKDDEDALLAALEDEVLQSDRIGQQLTDESAGTEDVRAMRAGMESMIRARTYDPKQRPELRRGAGGRAPGAKAAAAQAMQRLGRWAGVTQGECAVPEVRMAFSGESSETAGKTVHKATRRQPDKSNGDKCEDG